MRTFSLRLNRANSHLRPEIQGLRALAVTLVVAFHLRPDLVPGGYVGVDVFFVISGYLITAHLMKEARADGRIALGHFWSRRIRRLLPAAFTVLTFCITTVLLLVPRSLWTRSLGEILASATYSQNWLLAANSVDYLGAQNQPSLVQHFWSLSVEEQFYLVWPLVLALVVLVSRHRRVVAIALTAIFVASFVTSVAWTASSPASAYFATPTRAWEFAAGGLLAMVPTMTRSPRFASLLSWAGLGLIGVATFTLSGASAFPGWIAIVPVVGAAAVLLAGDPGTVWAPGLIHRLRPVQYLGELSYSVYLWHWPLIVLLPFITGQPNRAKADLAVVVLAVALAAATKRFIEDPFRRSTGPLGSRARSFTFMAAGVAALVTVSLVTSGVVNAQIQQQNSMMLAAIKSGDGCFGAAAMAPQNSCSDVHRVTSTVDPAQAAADIFWMSGAFSLENQKKHCGHIFCTFGETKHPRFTIAVVGDSHAQQFIDPIVEYGRSRGWRVITYTKSGCSELAAFTKNGVVSRADKIPIDWCQGIGILAADQLVERTDVDLVVYANYTKKADVSTPQALSNIARLKESGKRVAIIRDTPGPGTEAAAPQCVDEHRNENDPCSTPLPPESDQMTDIAAKAGVPLIDLSPYLCDTRCHIVTGGVIAYFDNNHLSGTYARSLAPFIGRDIEKVSGSEATRD